MPAEKAFLNNLTDAVDEVDLCCARTESRAGPRLPRGLNRAEITALLASLRTDRDRAIAGLILLSGLRQAEVLGLAVADVDIPAAGSR